MPDGSLSLLQAHLDRGRRSTGADPTPSRDPSPTKRKMLALGQPRSN